MNRILVDEDIHSLSEFRANATQFIKKVKKTKRPLILTQHGKSSAVILGVTEYENLMEYVEVVGDVRSARKEIAAGKGVAQVAAREKLMERLDA